ncbi:hypothetical protein BGX24_000059 [Mortierella sp. AD032]|nr:hypothetical protein BGX24_000059 [Mortierella sp. AD032]
MATVAHSTSTLSPTSSKQLRNEFVTAWLQQQIIDPTINCNCDDYLDTNQIEDYHVSDQQYLHLGTIPSFNSYHHLLQANHSTAPTSRTTLAQGHGHRRCLSLMNPSTSPVTPTQTTSYEEQLQQQVEWHRQNDEHLHTAATIATTVIPQYPEHPVHPFIEEHTPYWPPQRTAEELAWERHNYYLRLQAEEEELIERLQSDRKQSQGYRTQNKTLNHLWQPRADASSVARAGSLNRLSGPSLLSAETSRVLGLCRSSTLSAVKKIGFAKKDNISRSSRSTSPLPVSSNTNATQSIIDDDSILTRGLAIHSYERITTTTSDMTAATASSSTFFSFSPKSSIPSTMGASSPPPKKLLKDHLGPSLKSLARRCSTRFGRSSRSNSYAGPSGDAVVEYPHGRRSLGSHPLQQKQRGHLYDFKQLPTGPTGGSTEISTSSRPQEGRYRRSMSNERVPVHRTVTLFRSKSTRAPSSTSMVKKHDDHPIPITTVLDLPYRPHPNSLRFANGRGLDFSNTPNLTSVGSSPSHSNRSSVDFKRNAMSLSSLPSVVEDKEMVPIITTSLVDNLESPSAVFVSSLIPTSVLDFEEHESMRQQIVAILSLDRNDMRRRPSSKPRSRSTTPRIPQDHSSSQQEDQKQQQQPQHQLELECLSPLAVEAQEVLPEDPKTIQAQEVAAELADPCEHIAFMLVPKTQYEFQPLIAH